MSRSYLRQRFAWIAQNILGADRHGIAATRRRLLGVASILTLALMYLTLSQAVHSNHPQLHLVSPASSPIVSVVRRQRREIPEDVESDMSSDFDTPPDDGYVASAAAASTNGSSSSGNARQRRLRQNQHPLGAANVNSKLLTVVLMSYPKSSRFHILEKIIRKVTTWKTFVWEVILVWNGDATLVPAHISSLATNLSNMSSTPRPVPFRILPQSSNRVDNRWRIGHEIATEAVLNMDDDVDLFEVGAQCMFSVWQTTPSSLISIDVRSHFKHKDKSRALFGPWGYAARDLSDGYKKYSIALPRALLTSRQYYLAYEAMWNDTSSGLKAAVDELLCDDIAFSYVASNTTLTLPSHPARDAVVVPAGYSSPRRTSGGSVVYVKAKYEAYPESHSKDAMVHKPGMKPMRQKCVNRLSTDVFQGHMPLVHRRWHVLCDVDG